MTEQTKERVALELEEDEINILHVISDERAGYYLCGTSIEPDDYKVDKSEEHLFSLCVVCEEIELY